MTEAIAASDRSFASGACDQAIDELERFAPPHPRVEARLRDYCQERDRRADERAQQEAELHTKRLSGPASSSKLASPTRLPAAIACSMTASVSARSNNSTRSRPLILALTRS